jgi:hypothetical protein
MPPARVRGQRVWCSFGRQDRNVQRIRSPSVIFRRLLSRALSRKELADLQRAVKATAIGKVSVFVQMPAWGHGAFAIAAQARKQDMLLIEAFTRAFHARLRRPAAVRRGPRRRDGQRPCRGDLPLKLAASDVGGSSRSSRTPRSEQPRQKIRELTTQPYRPRTNGKVERFQQTMAREWAYGLVYRSSDDRAAALPDWLRHYNEQRPHSALGNRPPISRVRNV